MPEIHLRRLCRRGMAARAVRLQVQKSRDRSELQIEVDRKAGLPIWICLTMVSISTIASSIRMPVTGVMPSRLMVFRKKPRSLITMKAGMIESGRATAVIRVARQFRRTTNTASIASAALSYKVSIALA